MNLGFNLMVMAVPFCLFLAFAYMLKKSQPQITFSKPNKGDYHEPRV